MKIYSLTCTREPKASTIAEKLYSTLSSWGVRVKVLPRQKSIFEAYKMGVETICKDADDNDIIILCHDDIELLDSKKDFLQAISYCLLENAGIVGPAGTTLLGEDVVWWNQENWKNHKHRGLVKHIRNGQVYETKYGPPGQVVALDGLFLAATKKTWLRIGLDKPEYFPGNWDFYDIHYTTTAHQLGLQNFAVPMDIIHHSNGELVGRDSWHANREAFIKHTKLPITSY